MTWAQEMQLMIGKYREKMGKAAPFNFVNFANWCEANEPEFNERLEKRAADLLNGGDQLTQQYDMTKMPDDLVSKYQRQLLDQAQQTYQDTPISEATVRAFLATPRHLFVRHYRERASKEWRDVNASNLTEHLATLYADNPLTLFGDDDNNVPSTISQPSFVLRMLDLLQVRPGHAVLELGAGSAWNAALIGRLVGPSGRVVTLEIIPEVAARAAATIAELDITNVHVVSADGGDGYAERAPYDRIIFTAGTYDLPRPLYDQIRSGGLMLVVIKDAGGGDNLFLLEKVDDHFESRYAMPCGFVQLTGKYKVDTLDPGPVDALPQWSALKEKEIGDSASLVLARDDELISYGNAKATERLLRLIHRWVDLGMPTASSFGVRVFRGDRPLTARDDQWIVKRRESQFVWSALPGQFADDVPQTSLGIGTRNTGGHS